MEDTAEPESPPPNHDRQNPQMTISRNAAEFPSARQETNTTPTPHDQSSTPGLFRHRKFFNKAESSSTPSISDLSSSFWSRQPSIETSDSSLQHERDETRPHPIDSPASLEHGLNSLLTPTSHSPPDLASSQWAADYSERPRKWCKNSKTRRSPTSACAALTLDESAEAQFLPQKAVDDGSEDASSSSSGKSTTSTTTAKSSRERAGVTENKSKSLKSLGQLDETERTLRAASPAKRTRAEMEVRDEKADEERAGADTMDVDNERADARQGKSKRAATTLKNDAVHPAGESLAAVDMSRELSTSSYTTAITSRMRNASFETPGNDSQTTAADVKSEHSISSDTTLHEPAATMSTTDSATPSLDEQMAGLMKAIQQPLEEGMAGYVIPSAWLEKAQKLGSEAKESDEIGQLDTSGLFMVVDASISDLLDERDQPFVPLRPGLQMGVDIEIIPKEAWQSIKIQFGLTKGSKPIVRYCHNTSGEGALFENLSYELYPPIFTLLKLPDSNNSNSTKLDTDKSLSPVKIQARRSEPFQSFLRRARNKAHIPPSADVRVWRILGGLKEALVAQPGLVTPSTSRSNSPAPPTSVPNGIVPVDPGKSLVLDAGAFIELTIGPQRELIESPDPTSQAAAQVDLAAIGLGQEGVLVLEEQTSAGVWVSVHVAETLNKLNGTSRAKRGKNSGLASRASRSPSGPNTRGRAARNGRVPGTVGLGNLGNSCYMNSALQCVRSISELTQYFLQGHFRAELNPKNPLGHNGDVAKAYSNLLKELYKSEPSISFTPKTFKQIIGRYGASFSGYQQQDSQEFLLFLLDGLQEDLNRISKKPYIEKPDSTDEMVHDPKALAAFADKCWDIYKARNDSVITDLCAGQYKSTLHCPVCDKVSIIFDPFNNLTLQLPIQNLWSRSMLFFPLYSRPVKTEIDIDKNATTFQLKEMIGKRFNVDPRKLVMAEIFNNKFYKTFEDNLTPGTDVPDSDVIVLCEVEEVPTNTQIPKKKGARRYGDSDAELDPSVSDCLLVPVLNQCTTGGNTSLIGHPSFITLTREEAKDYNAILAKVLAKVSTMTTRKIFDEDNASSATENEEPDMVTLTHSDLESSGSNIQSHSVSDDDGMVEISVKPSIEDKPSPHISYPPQPVINRSPPSILTKDGLIPEKLRTLFQLRVYEKSNEPIGNNFNSKRRLSTLLTRLESKKTVKKFERKPRTSGSSEEELSKPRFKVPPRVSPRPSYTAKDTAKDSQEDISTDDDEDQGVAISETPGASASMVPQTTVLTDRPKNLRTYGKHNRRPSLSRFLDGAGDSADESDNLSSAEVKETKNEFLSEDPLIVHGEGLVLDWTEDAFDGLFGGDKKDRDEIRGVNTWDSVPLLSDPATVKARLARGNRKKNGFKLEECLDEFQKEEVLSESDTWYCPRCKDHRRASKKFELWKCPDILIIHLKRFSSQGRYRDKLDMLVEFPIEGLDMTHRVADTEGKEMIYDLFAVDNHYGGLGGGHYTAYAKNAFNGAWYDCNDAHVNRLHSDSQVLTTAAYLLFYRRRNPEVLGGAKLASILNSKEGDSDDSGKTTSRSASLDDGSGEGQGLDISPRNGYSSASASHAVVRRTGGDGQRPRRNVIYDEDDDEQMEGATEPSLPPRYPSGIREATDDDDDLDKFNVPTSPARTGFFRSPVGPESWSFNRLNSLHGDQDHISEPGDLDSVRGHADADNLGEDWPNGMDVEHDYEDRPDYGDEPEEEEVLMVHPLQQDYEEEVADVVLDDS